MEGPPVLGPSPREKRRSWARQSRCWRSTAREEEEEEEEEEVPPSSHDVPFPQPPELGGLPGSPSSSIETWLQQCGSPPPHPWVQCSPSILIPGDQSSEDDLTLGAEALLLSGSTKTAGRAPWGRPPSVGHSTASSALCGVTNRSSSSISEVLDCCQADAEEILYDLGFVRSEPGAVARVPARFFSTPSRARGIDFQLFLKAQVRRLEMEDPCMMLASRFQQVQALAATADAFFCLYSYVSKTPVLRISPSPLTRTDPGDPETQPPPSGPPILSPSERLRTAVSKMCLYTTPCPGVSLGTVVREVLERSRGGNFRFDPKDVRGRMGGGGCGGAGGSSRLGQGVCHQMDVGYPKPYGEVGDAPCPPGAGWGHAEDGWMWWNIASSPSPDNSDTPTRPGRHGDSWTPPTGRGGGRQQRGEPPDPHGTEGGEQWGQRGGGWHGVGDAPGPQPPRMAQTVGGVVSHRNVGSFEMEEVLSGSDDGSGTHTDDDDDDDDDDEGSSEEASCSTRFRRCWMLRGVGGHSDSSGFVEEPLPEQTTPGRSESVQVDRDGSTLGCLHPRRT